MPASCGFAGTFEVQPAQERARQAAQARLKAGASEGSAAASPDNRALLAGQGGSLGVPSHGSQHSSSYPSCIPAPIARLQALLVDEGDRKPRLDRAAHAPQLRPWRQGRLALEAEIGPTHIVRANGSLQQVETQLQAPRSRSRHSHASETQAGIHVSREAGLQPRAHLRCRILQNVAAPDGHGQRARPAIDGSQVVATSGGEAGGCGVRKAEGVRREWER